ncbi:MAG: sigma-70 family RNA polymerase sigma factor [Bacteroidales bacterium]|nr:sigma-70 family RNA polymerase sigma factor [Bacteroidales bacterium]MCF8402485.1 sigma-70 family RNA polymerase sigma factor [Bacteroidales bacterium]
MAVERKIVEDCIVGKRRAQTKLYKYFAPGMLGLCMRYSKSREEAEDILQEGFIKVFTNINKLKEISALASWIRSIMINTAITHLKKNKIYFEPISDSNYPSEVQDDIIFEPVDQNTLIQIIQNLPDGYRTVLNLYVFEGYMHKEISNLLNISENTSKSQLSKARKMVRLKLDEINKIKNTAIY